MAYKSRLTSITDSLITCLNTMNTSAGYNFTTGTVNEVDFNKANFPLYNIFLYPEERSLESASFPGMSSYRNSTQFEIHCYQKVQSENANNIFEIDYILNALLHDIKKIIGNNPTLLNTVEYIGYVSSRRENSGYSDDIFIPKVLIVTIEIYYSENALSPDELGCN